MLKTLPLMIRVKHKKLYYKSIFLNMKKQVKHQKTLETIYIHLFKVCKIVCHERIAKMDARAYNYLSLRFVFLTIYLSKNHLFI